MNRQCPSLDFWLSVMLICLVASGFIVMLGFGFVTGVAIGKFLLIPLLELLA